MKKAKKFFSILEKVLLGVYTPVQLLKIGAATKAKVVESKEDGTKENTVGYENINIHYNTEVHSNNFVILHVSTSDYNDITAIENTDGVNVWYGNVCNGNFILYDHVNNGDIIGESCDNYLYLLYKKSLKFPI